MKENPDMSDEEKDVLYEAWEQQDLYPCKSGETIRVAINAEAVAEATDLYLRRQAAASCIRAVSHAAKVPTVFVVTQTPASA